MFAAAAVTDSSVRIALIDSVRAYASAGLSNSGNTPLAVVYNAGTSQELTNSSNSGGINRYVSILFFHHFLTYASGPL